MFAKSFKYTLLCLSLFKVKCNEKLESRYFTSSIKDYIIRTADESLAKNMNNDYYLDSRDISFKSFDFGKNISEYYKDETGNLGIDISQNMILNDFISKCNPIYDENEVYKNFRDFIVNNKVDDKDPKKRLAELFLQLLIIELDYVEKIKTVFTTYYDNNLDKSEKVSSSDKDFFVKFNSVKFYKGRAEILIEIINSLLKSIDFFIKNSNDKDKTLDFIIHQTCNKIVNMDYLWIMYTYGIRPQKTFNQYDSGFNPFPNQIFLSNV